MSSSFELQTLEPTPGETSSNNYGGTEETSFEDSSSRVALMSVEPPHEDTRMRTRLLTYVRQRYLTIFLYLLALIILLLVLVAVLLYLYLSPPAIQNPEHQDSTITTELITTTYSSADTTTFESSEFPDDNPWIQRKPCSRVKCTNTSCHPTTVDYASMRGYTCCDCFDRHFTFRRFRYDYLRDRVSLVFQVPETITSVSKQDLLNMKPLPNLNGMWNKQQESDTAWYYVYESVSIPEVPEE